MNNETQPSAIPPAAPPPTIPNDPGQPINDYQQLPWYRKSSVNTGLILASLFTCGLFPGTIVVCINALSGEIYFNKKDEHGQLKKWHWGNKVVAVILLLLNLVRLIQLFLGLSAR